MLSRIRPQTLVLILVFCVLLEYGLAFCITAVCCFVSLIVGFFTFRFDVARDALPRRGCATGKGHRVIIDSKISDDVPYESIVMSKSPELNAVFDQILSYILRDYVRFWYEPLTPDNKFPTELHILLKKVMKNVVDRISNVNWTPVLTEDLPYMFTNHVRLYRSMLQRCGNQHNIDECLKSFFDCESEMDKTICREFICVDRLKEQAYLRRLSEHFLFFTVPEEEYRVPAIRYITRELLVHTVIIPILDLLSDPDYVNRLIVWFAPDNAFNSEYFIQALKMSDSTEELQIMVEQISAFRDKLRGRDTGGDDSASIKAQLSSLEYVRQICLVRLKQIKEGLLDKPENILNYHLARATRLYDLTFKEVLSSSIAIVRFINFLTSVDKLYLLHLYVDCLEFRDAARKERGDSPLKSDYHPSLYALVRASGLSEPAVSNEDQDLAAATRDVDEDADEEEVEEAFDALDETAVYEVSSKPTDSLRSLGVALCNDLLQHLPTSAEPLVQQVLRTVTTRSDFIDPETFTELEAKILELLCDSQCFGAFKRSTQYVEMLMELDLLKDPVDQPMEATSISMSSSVPALNLTASKTNNEVNGKPDGVSNQLLTSSLTSNVESKARTYTAKIVRSEIMRDSYVMYTIKVTAFSPSNGQSDTWHTLRRFSQFAELHSLIADRCGRVSMLKLPSKRAFSNLSPDFLSRRRRELDEYLAVMCGSEFQSACPTAISLVVEFLQPDSWETGRAQSRTVNALLTPFRSVSNAMMSMPDTLADGFNRIISGRGSGALADRWRRQGSFDLPGRQLAGSSMDLSGTDEGPIGMFFVLVDEVFSMQQKPTLTRQANFVILRGILQALFGPRMNKMIISKVKEMLRAHKLAEMFAHLRDYVWPPNTDQQYVASQRSQETKLSTRVLCRTMLLGSFSEELAPILGNETTRRGVLHLFRLLQCRPLNRRFLHLVLEAALHKMFPAQSTYWRSLVEQCLCPVSTNRPCRLHSNTGDANRQ